jgi:hypothetical protein
MFLIDVGDSSPEQLTLVRLVMKGVRISREDLWKSLNLLPEEKRMDRKTFDESLTILVREEWLWEVEKDGQVIYSPRLKTNEGKPK